MVGPLLSQNPRAEKPKPSAWPSGLVGFGLGVGRGCFFVAGDADALGVFAGLAAFLFGHVAAVLHAAAGIALATVVRDDSVLIQPLGGLLLRLL